MEDETPTPWVFYWTELIRERLPLPATCALPPPAQGWGDLVPVAPAGARTVPGRNGSGQ